MGHAEVCRVLIENGANVNAVNGFGCTPLLEATLKREVCTLLIEKGAHLNAVDRKGLTPFLRAANHFDLEMSALFFRAMLRLSKEQKRSIVRFIGCLKKKKGRSRDESVLLGKWLARLERAENRNQALAELGKVPRGINFKTRLLEMLNIR
jgi:ankyrin repeat protein